MARVLLRPLRVAEQRVLTAKLADKSLPARKHQRYRVIAEARKGRPGSAIADRVGCHPNTVYSWIHRFNESGFEEAVRLYEVRWQVD